MDTNPIMIRDLPQDLRPRERMERDGAAALSVSELLAILLRNGVEGVSVMQLADKVVSRFGGLRGLASATLQELSTIKGIGLAKACQLKAAFELGKRLATLPEALHPVITGPDDAANMIQEVMRYYAEEHFHVFFLDTRNQVIDHRDIHIGTLNASLVHPREVFRSAIAAGAAAVIVAHNHPSGDPTPSKEDLALTARLKQAGELVGIPVLDHLIIGNPRYVSMKTEGMM